MALGNIKKEIAVKYGKALFDAAISAKSLDAVSSNANDMLELVKDKDIGHVIHNPLIKKADKKAAFAEISGQLKWDNETINLVNLLIENKRFFAISDVMEKFLDLCELNDGKTPVTMVSAYDVDASQKESLTADLTKKLGKPVKLISKIDPKIIGGLQLKIDSLLIDGSIQGKLQRLKNVMKGV